MTSELKNQLLEKLDKATKASTDGQHRVAAMYMQDARAMLYGTPTEAATPMPACPLPVRGICELPQGCPTACQRQMRAALAMTPVAHTEQGWPMDSVAMALGLDIFDYSISDVLRTIAALQASIAPASDEVLAVLEPQKRAAHLVALAAGLLELAASQAERPELNPNSEQVLYTVTTQASTHLRAAERLLLGILEANPEQPGFAFQECGECGFSTVQLASQARLMCPICSGDKGDEEWMSKRPARLLDKPEGRDLRREDEGVTVKGGQQDA